MFPSLLIPCHEISRYKCFQTGFDKPFPKQTNYNVSKKEVTKEVTIQRRPTPALNRNVAHKNVSRCQLIHVSEMGPHLR